MKNIGKKSAKWTTLCKITGPGGNVHKRARDKSPKNHQIHLERSKWTKKGREKKAQTSANVLDIPELAQLSIQTSESIDFSCYVTSEKVEWFLDSGCTDHITPRKSDFVQYTELGQASKAEITNGKYLTIEGYGTVIGQSIMPNGTASLQI